MIKKNLKVLIIISIIILLPMVAGLILWNQLPAQMPTHFNIHGEADGWSSRAFAVFGIPVFLLAVHLLCLFEHLVHICSTAHAPWESAFCHNYYFLSVI